MQAVLAVAALAALLGLGGCIRHADGSVTHVVLGLGFITVPGEIRVDGRFADLGGPGGAGGGAGGGVAGEGRGGGGGGGGSSGGAGDGSKSPETVRLWAMEAVGLMASLSPPSPGVFLGYLRGQASAVPVGAEVLTEIRHTPGGSMTMWVRGMASDRDNQPERGGR